MWNAFTEWLLGRTEWVASTIGAAIYDSLAWVVEQLWFWSYGVFTYMWGWCADMLFTWVGEALALVSITPGDATTVMNILRTMNWFFPVDMVVTLLPGWCAFESALLVIRFLIAAWRSK